MFWGFKKSPKSYFFKNKKLYLRQLLRIRFSDWILLKIDQWKLLLWRFRWKTPQIRYSNNFCQSPDSKELVYSWRSHLHSILLSEEIQTSATQLFCKCKTFLRWFQTPPSFVRKSKHTPKASMKKNIEKSDWLQLRSPLSQTVSKTQRIEFQHQNIGIPPKLL